MKLLSIETSCDETSVAVLEIDENDRITILSNIVSSQIKVHAEFGGVVPHLAAREHVKNIDTVFVQALKEAKIDDLAKEIDLIVVTRGPGLGPALLTGITFARTLAWKYDKPLVGANHLEGHIYSNWLNNNVPNIFPILNLVVSGGHTELVLMKNHGEYEKVGETQDDAVGEAFDKVARLLGLGYPGGPIVSKLAEEGNSEKYPLPRPMIHSHDFNFSYSGLKTAVLYLLRDLNIKSPTPEIQKDVCASFQKAATEVLVTKTIKAARKLNARSILLSGGVSANRLLRRELQDAATELGIPYSQPELKFTGDNAAMVGVAGYFNYTKQKTPRQARGKSDWKSVTMDANLSF